MPKIHSGNEDNGVMRLHGHNLEFMGTFIQIKEVKRLHLYNRNANVASAIAFV